MKKTKKKLKELQTSLNKSRTINSYLKNLNLILSTYPVYLTYNNKEVISIYKSKLLDNYFVVKLKDDVVMVSLKEKRNLKLKYK